jgi:hypothetical protein
VVVTGWLLAILLLCTVLPARAQLGDMIYTVGTSRSDGGGRQWAYVLWQASSPEQIAGRFFAVYAKAGNANSASPYQRQAVVFRQLHPDVIQPLLQRATNLGDDPVRLDDRLTAVFEELMPSPMMTTAEKLSVVFQAASADPRHYENLLNLARLHPSVNLCLGTAWTGEVPAGVHTFEVREFDLATQQDRAVVGRVTVDTANPVVLPAPGAPFAFSENSPQGDLNLKLRWATPDNLRRLSLLSYGYNVYRMNRAFAEGAGYHLTPPTPATLVGLVGGNPAVRRVNDLPVLPEQDLSAAEAVNAADVETFFLADDNQRFFGGPPFHDGDEFYYFITARDILGRDGLVSPGGLGTVCDKFPPLIPGDFEARYDYVYAGGAGQQRYKLVWRQNDSPGPQGEMRYYIYRWTNTVDIPLQTPNPALKRIGIVNHLPGQTFNEFIDTGVTLPPQPGQTIQPAQAYWYTIRAAELTACGANLSGNSGPVQAVLRDWAAPDAPGGRLTAACVEPRVDRVAGIGTTQLPTTYPNPTLNTDQAEYRLVATRADPRIQWIEFFLINESVALGRHYFTGDDPVVHQFRLPRIFGDGFNLLARAGMSNGGESLLLSTHVSTPPTGQGRIAYFQVVTVSDGKGAGCPGHDPIPPTPGDPINPIIVDLIFNPAVAKEWRVYRSVDGGPKTLFSQGEVTPATPNPLPVPDGDLPANAGEVCYFGQILDANGNGSALAILGCVLTGGHTPLPVPKLLPLESAGDASSPKLRISWFCPPQGVDHFNIYISAPGLPNDVGGGLSPNQLNPPAQKTPPGATNSLPFKRFKTPAVGPAFGNGAEFSVEIAIEPGKSNVVHVAAVGKNTVEGGASNYEGFIWHAVTPSAPDVPWPARGLPAVNNPFAAGIFAYRIPTVCTNRVGIRIGEAIVRQLTEGNQTINNCPAPFGVYYLNSTNNPVSYLYTDPANGRTIFPLALYRMQVANARFPTVSHDVVQVSPMMEKIAYTAFPGGGSLSPAAIIADPFIAVIPDKADRAFANFPFPDGRHGIYVLDTTPLLAKAAYQYFIARFSPDGEIEQIIPTNIIDLEVTP